jgi:hypothetical protein
MQRSMTALSPIWLSFPTTCVIVSSSMAAFMVVYVVVAPDGGIEIVSLDLER